LGRRRVVIAAALLVVAACTTPAASAAVYPLSGQAVAGPTCPVEPASPSPGQCAPRPVAGATIVITDAAGHEVARLTTAADGTFTTTLAAGTYTLTPQPVTGLLGVAPVQQVTVSASGPTPTVEVSYDTGIR